MRTGSGFAISCQVRLDNLASSPKITDFLSAPCSGSPRPVSPGATYPNASATGTRCSSDSTDGPRRGSGNRCSWPCKIPTWNGCCSIALWSEHTSTLRAQKGATPPGVWAIAGRILHQDPRFDRQLGQPDAFSAERRPGGGHLVCGALDRGAVIRRGDRGQRLRQRSPGQGHREPRRRGGDPAQEESERAAYV